MRDKVHDFRKETVWRGPIYNSNGYDKSLQETQSCKQTCGIWPRNGAKVMAKTEVTTSPKLINRFQ